MPSLDRRASSTSLRAAAPVASTTLHTNIAFERTADSTPALLSSASSIFNGDNDNIIVNDTRSDLDSEDSRNSPLVEGGFSRDEEAQHQLRDHLRRTLSHQSPSSKSFPDRIFNQHRGVTHRQYFVLTDAGKPVFAHRTNSELTDAMEEDDTVTITGLIQAIISVFADDGDKLKFINSGGKRITFAQRPPLYLVCVGSVHEPVSVAKQHLDYLYLQIISICTSFQIKRMFQRRANTDLQRLLQGSNSVIRALIHRMPIDLGIALSSLISLRLDPSLRNQASEALVPAGSLRDVLYAILLADNKVITLARPRRHSIHPVDLHIILNMLSSPALTSASASASASWLPICLPKYNPDGFTHTYVSYIQPQSQLTFICVCGASDFEAIRSWGEALAEKMQGSGLANSLVEAAAQADYSVTDLGVPGLRHFVYKSKLHLQLTLPAFETPYATRDAQISLVGLYQLVYDALHAKSGQAGPLKLQFMRTENESIIGWVTQPFEVYVALSSGISKSAAIAAANAVVRWVRGEEQRLFIKDAPVF